MDTFEWEIFAEEHLASQMNANILEITFTYCACWRFARTNDLNDLKLAK